MHHETLIFGVFPELEVFHFDRVESHAGDWLGARGVDLEIWVLCEVDDSSQDGVNQFHVQLTHQE